MLGGIHTDLLVTVTLLFLTQTGTVSRAENDFSLVTLPEWRSNSEYVTQCFYDGHNNFICDWTISQQRTADGAVTILESGPLWLEGEACLEFWYKAGTNLRALLKTSTGLKAIWSSHGFPDETWRQVFVPLNIIEPGTQVVIEAVQTASTEGVVTLKQIGVRNDSCGPQCESNTEIWTDESTRCLCSAGQLSCSLSHCPQGQICGPQRAGSSEILASGTCTIHSGTDCSTFDGVLFRFMAPCSYMLAKSCSSREALSVFSVEMVNEQIGNSSLPTVQQVVLSVGNYRISLLKEITQRVVVNGIWRTLPLELFNVNITNNPVAVFVKTSFGLSVSYDVAGAVNVILPTTYSDKVCGLCGNFNNLKEDDFLMPDGRIARDPTALAQSWETEETDSTCKTMLVPHDCDPMEEAEYASEMYCGSLHSSSGPFADCLSVVGVESYFRGCVAGMCTTHGDPLVLCETFMVYADICRDAGVPLPLWRNSTFCPLQCGENSHYNSCADGCADVCSPLDITSSCGSCEERCVCDSGYKLTGGRCVPAEDCGCWNDGKHYEKGEILMEGECFQQCTCMGNNVMNCKAVQCATNEVCKVKDGVKGCYAIQPATCRVYGDPHYITFDGLAYDFQGGCSYTLTTTCGTESGVKFAVIGHSMHPALQNFTRSKLQAVSLHVDDLQLTLNMSGEVYMNNNPVGIPSSSSGTYGSVWVKMWNNFITLETTFGLRIMIDGQNRLFLQVDEDYKYELCGLCGTYSEHQDDDFVTSGGQNATGAFEFADSWRLPGDDECVIHPNNPRVCDIDEENEAYGECYTLLGEAFRPCHEKIHPSIYLNSCVYDYCATSGDQYTLCESLKSYAAACEVAGVELKDWQMNTACAVPTTTAPPQTTASSSTPDQTLCPMNCDFETNLCGWEQLVQDSFDWTRHSGPTPTDQTGPDQDHTTGAGYYMYIEGNSVVHGDSARLMSSMCHYDGPLCLNFWYHMHGSASAMALNVYLLKGNKPTKIWSMKNDQGPQWHPAKVDIKDAGPFQIIVEAIRGSNDQSDVAIDDVSIHFGTCSRRLHDPVSGTTLPSTSHPVCSLGCSFDSNLCSWSQMVTDAFDWTWHSGSTPTLMTGPSADHTGGGHYLYIEASSATHGDTARLISSECSDSGPQCLQFWYHMHGSAETMGLHVYLLQGRLAEAIWWKRNDQGNMWQLAQVDFTPTETYKIIIEGRRGSNEESDVAIDDVMIYHGHCSDLSDAVTTPPLPGDNTIAPAYTTEAPEPPLVNVTIWPTATDQPPVEIVTLPPAVDATTESASVGNVTENSYSTPVPHPVCQMDCSFEQDLCQWSQLLTDVFDWTRQSGPTPTLMTGPLSDHTTGDGHYLYIEADGVSLGDTARLLSSECVHSGPQCLQFWYHMHGSAETMGLHVYLLEDRLANGIWWRRNDQGSMWQLAQVDFTPTGAFQIIFEGRRGSNEQSDVAIDDVSLHYGHCSDLNEPVTPAPTIYVTDATEGPELPSTNSTTATQPSTAKPTSTTNQSTDKPQPTTENQGLDTSAQPEPDITATPQVTAWTDEPDMSTDVYQTTAGPQPATTVYVEPETSEQPNTDMETTPQPEPSTTALLQPTATDGPKPPTTAKPQPPVTDQTQPQTTAGQQDQTTVYPQLPTTAQPQPPTTDRPRPPTTAQPQPPTTARPKPPTTDRPRPPTTARPQPPTTVQPLPPTTARPQPPTTVQPQPPTTARPQPPTTARPQPPTTARPQPPTTALPQPPTTARPQPPTTARPQPPTTAQPQPPTTARPQPPTTARPKPPTTAQPQPPTTVRPQPPTTAPPLPHPTTSKPNPTSKPQYTTTVLPQSTTSKPSNTPVPTPSCPEDSHYTTCVPACSPTCSDLNGPSHCSDNEGCRAGCVCNDGFVNKGGICVPIQLCGCLDKDGTRRQFSEVWYTSHCSQKCKCKRDHGVGRIDCDDKLECDGNAVCLPTETDDYFCQSTGFSECSIKGDPEYRTFDKLKHDFVGRFSYVLVQTKNLPNNLQDVYIVGINKRTDSDDDSHEHDDSSSEEDDSRRIRDKDDDDDDDSSDQDDSGSHHDSSDEDDENNSLQALRIRVYNHTVEFRQKRRLIMDGERTNTPVYIPGLSIWQHSSRINLKTDFGLSVEFDGESEAEIILPNIYKRKVGGLCGHFDGRKQNDMMKPDGTIARNVQEFGESWRV